jgi:UDP-N-acetylglucosamine 4,6-dehydratase
MENGGAPSILLTGGTGTFGEAAARLLLSSDGGKIIIFSRDEQKQDLMRRRLDDPDGRLRFFVGDVRDEGRLMLALRGVDAVIHAAAMKIVPACEHDPSEAVKTNILGTQNVVTAALRSGVRRVVGLSTDKAVSPANLYGATKLAAEKLIVAANNLSGGETRFSAVRYGNVAASRGSVIPLWTELASRGEELPITDERMTRFWLSPQDAAQFVMGALDAQQGGEVFIPKMPSFRVIDLAAAIWGGDDFPRRIIGIRPGEKLHEDLVTRHEALNVAQNERAYVICPPWMAPSEPPPEGFHLTSETNEPRLSTEDLGALLRDPA